MGKEISKERVTELEKVTFSPSKRFRQVCGTSLENWRPAPSVMEKMERNIFNMNRNR